LAYAWRRFRAPKQASLSFWSMLPNTDKTFGSMEPEFYLEQPPDPSNRVSLSTELDSVGCRRTLVTWRWGQQSRDSAHRAGILLNKSFERARLGRLVPLRHPRVHTTGHHHLAGSSVFCTGDYANPTLTIIALAIRLAEHLKKELQPLMVRQRD